MKRLSVALGAALLLLATIAGTAAASPKYLVLYKQQSVPATAAADVGKAGGRLVAPTETDYGLLEFALVDPSGCLVRIGGALGA